MMRAFAASLKTYMSRDGNRNVVLLIAYLILQTTAFSLLTPYFMTPSNLINLMRQIAEMGMITIPVAMLILSGNIDLSVGAVMGVCAISLARMLKSGLPIGLSILLTLCIGAAMGCINGFFVAKLHLAGIVATIGTQVMLRGACFILTGGRPVSGLPKEFLAAAKWNLAGIPMTFLLMIAAFLAALFFMKRTSFGVKLHAIGYNKRASQFSGIHADRILFGLYVFSGVVAAIAATFMLTRFASAESAFGTNYDTDVLTSVLIGGMSIAGGSGNLLGALFGLLTIGMLRNGMNHMEISALYQQMILGILIVISAAKWKKQKA